MTITSANFASGDFAKAIAATTQTGGYDGNSAITAAEAQLLLANNTILNFVAHDTGGDRYYTFTMGDTEIRLSQAGQLAFKNSAGEWEAIGIDIKNGLAI